MEQQFKVGDIVEVTNPGKNFSTHEDAFKVFGFRDKSVNRPFNKGEIGEVFNTGIINNGEHTVSIRHKDGRECLIGISGVKLKSSNMELKITKDKVLAAAAKCSTAKATLETLFPEAFEEEKEDIVFDEQFGMPGLKYKNGRHLVWLSPSKKDIYLDKSQSWSIVDEGTVLKLIPTRKTS